MARPVAEVSRGMNLGVEGLDVGLSVGAPLGESSKDLALINFGAQGLGLEGTPKALSFSALSEGRDLNLRSALPRPETPEPPKLRNPIIL